MILDLDLIEFEEYLKRKQLKQNSIYQYIKVLQKFLVGKPNKDDINSYNDFIIKECINKRKSHVYSVLVAYIKFRISDLSKRTQFLDKLIKPKTRLDIKRERIYLNEEQIFSVINALEKLKHKVISIIMHLTGLRIGDIMKLEDGKIFFEEENNKSIMRLGVTGKRGKRNVPYIYDEIAQKIVLNYLEKNPSKTGYYFLELGTFGSRIGDLNNLEKLYNMNYHWYWRDLKQALEYNNLDKNLWAPHDYRRCFARRAYIKFDKDIQVLRSLLNHSNVNTTLRYLEQSGLTNMDYYKEMQA